MLGAAAICVSPSFLAANITYGRVRAAVISSNGLKTLSSSPSFSNFYGFLVRKLVGRFSTEEKFEMSDILPMGNPFEIFRTIIHRVPINVVNIGLVIGIWDKSICDKAMKPNPNFVLPLPQAGNQIPATRASLSAFEKPLRSQALKLTQIGNSVTSIKRDVAPNFLHNSIHQGSW